MQEPSAFQAVKLQYPEQEQLKCPRCDSANTKFCYYNNYNLSQPRHFCKSCRRYWTKGGTLRNIPVGGGSRKNNKRSSNPKRSSSSSQGPTRTPPPLPADPSGSDNPGGNDMDDKKMMDHGTNEVNLLMEPNGHFGSLLEGPSPSGTDVKMFSFGEVVGGSSTLGSGLGLSTGSDNTDSIATGYAGLQSGETSYWSVANGWPDLASFNPPRSSIQ